MPDSLNVHFVQNISHKIYFINSLLFHKFVGNLNCFGLQYFTCLREPLKSTVENQSVKLIEDHDFLEITINEMMISRDRHDLQVFVSLMEHWQQR